MARLPATVDEVRYLDAGRSLVNEGWKRPDTVLQGPLPFLANQLLLRGDLPRDWRGSPDEPGLLLWGRLGLLPFGLLAGWLLGVWARRVWGEAAGVGALALFATSPMLVGYGGLLLVDMAHTALVLATLYLLWRFLERPVWRRSVGVGIVLGASFATKYLALFNALPVVLIAGAGAAAHARSEGTGWGRALGRGTAVAATVGAAALIALHACYGFPGAAADLGPDAFESAFLTRLAGFPGAGALLALLPEPFLRGVDFQKAVGERPWTTYFEGRYGSGHPLFYLAAWAWKTPELASLLLLVAVPRVLAGARRSTAEARLALVLVPPFLVYGLYLSLGSSLQLGIRYVLPLLALAVLVSAAVLGPVRAARPRLAGVLLVGLAAASQLAATLRTWPNSIAYFNTIAGGELHAYRHFTNSNADYGQLIEVGLERMRERESAPFDPLRGSQGPRFGRYAIYVSMLSCPDPEDPSRSRHWLDPFDPIAHVGAAWYLFDVRPEEFERVAADPRTLEDLAGAYLGARRFDDAARIAARIGGERGSAFEQDLRAILAAERSGAGREELLAAADAWVERGQHHRARELMESEAATRCLEAPERVERVARCWSYDGELDTAIALLEGSPRSRSAELFLVRLYQRTARIEQAVAAVRRLGEGGALPREGVEEWIGRILEQGAGAPSAEEPR